MEIKVGNWYRLRDGGIGYVCGKLLSEDTAYPFVLEAISGITHTITRKGLVYNESESSRDLIEHLPDCDSFTWEPKPKLQLREGAWYRNASGKVVGPCKASTARNGRQWVVNSIFYKDDGTNSMPEIWLVEEVPDPTPKPTYRPFASAEEFAPHRDRWITRAGGIGCFRITAYSNTDVWGEGVSSTYVRYFKDGFKFEDGTPFGVKVS